MCVSAVKRKAIEATIVSRSFDRAYPEAAIVHHESTGSTPIAPTKLAVVHDPLPAAPRSAHWIDAHHAIRHLVALWDAADFKECLRQNTCSRRLDELRCQLRGHSDSAGLTLLIVGTVEGFSVPVHASKCQFELGVNVRHEPYCSATSLSELLATYAIAMGCPDSTVSNSTSIGEEILQGMGVKDVLFNSAPARRLSEAFLGALLQVVPKSTAETLYDAFPTFHSLYARCRLPGGADELARMPIKGKTQRIGPKKAAKICRMMCATPAQADDPLKE